MTLLQDGNDKNGSRPLISREPGDGYEPALNEYFLASRTLDRSSVVNLLLSSAFGVNAILYAAGLGYLMGLWALVIQIAWSLSYVLLSRFVRSVSGVTSLHDFLGQRFGITTRRIAAICSVVGLTYFVGWEVNIARATLGGFVNSSNHSPIQWLVARATLFVGAGAAIAIIYSSLFGRRADAHANKILNVVKSILLIGSVALLTGSAVFASHSALSREMLPPLPQAISAVGAIGLATNILFNLAWQFVDNSSWQSFNSGEATDQKGMRRDLNRSALWVFITVNSLGTLIGSLMRGVGGVTSNNILVKMSQAVPHWNEAFAIAICILVFASMVSLVDVIVLAITQALVVDISILNQKMPLVRRRHARFAVLLVGIFAAWGVQAWVSWLGGSIFNFVYIVVIAQLSLIGPVLIGLLRPSKVTSRMWLAILAGAVIGFLSSILGTVLDMATLVNGAGVFAVSASIAGAVFLEACAYRKARAC